MPKTFPSVSIVCAWHNRAEHVDSTLNSLLNQDYPNFDITIVNDGSTDAGLENVLNRYNGGKVKIIHQPNQGFTAAISRAISESNGDFVAVQGAGDISHPKRISMQVDAMMSSDDVGLVGSWYYRYNPMTNSLISHRPKAPGKYALVLFGFSHGELMYRREIYQKVGGYNINFPVGQGSELWARLLEESRALVVPHTLYLQKIFHDGVSSNKNLVSYRSRLDKERQYATIFSRVSNFLEKSDGYLVFFFRILCRSSKDSRFLLNVVYFLLFRRFRSPLFRGVYLRYFRQSRVSPSELSGWLER
jgi:glycosyltransferase involved in cell wall biosynthesis